MDKLNRAVDRFAFNHPNFGIPNLIRIVLGGQLLVFLLAMFSRDASVLNFLAFDLAHLLRGEVWRLVTWVFLPTTYSPFSFIISLLCYYSIAVSLERTWGTAKFSLYYFSGMAASVLAVALASLLSGIWGWSLAGPSALHTTLFMALAVLYPDAVFNLWIVIFPLRVKARWLAIFYGIVFCLELLNAITALDIVSVVLLLVTVLNFLVFFWVDLKNFLGVQTSRARHQTSAQTIHFKTAAYKQQKKEAAQGYRHKCTVCGRTDAQFPDLEFRYCSRCAGYHCYCADHIFAHEHITE